MDIVKIASIITSVTIIITFIYHFYKVAINVNKIINRTETNTLLILKLLILNEDIPLQERIKYGEEYLKLGGNGYIKKIYEHLLIKLDEELNKDKTK